MRSRNIWNGNPILIHSGVCTTVLNLYKAICYSLNVDPPSGYLSPAVDILGTLAEIRSNASANKYESQYAFDTAIQTLIGTANEGHLSISTCSYSVFTWKQLAIVSISEDGVLIPNVYFYGNFPCVLCQATY